MTNASKNGKVDLLPCAIQNGNYWAIRTERGQNTQVAWIEDSQVSEDKPPGRFSLEEAKLIQKQFPNSQIWNLNTQQIESPMLTKQNSASTAPTNKTKRGKLLVPRGDRNSINRTVHPTRPHRSDEPRDLLEHIPTAFLWILLVMLLLALGVAISWNVQPFIEMTARMANSVGGKGAEEILSKIPFIGPMLLGIGGGILVVTGLVWFAIFQLLELAPMLMTASSKRVLRMINAIAHHAGVQIRPGDNADVVWLKQKYNNRPVASLQFFRSARIVVLTMEAAICWITNPPTPGTPIDFLFFLVTGQFSKINWGNVFLMLSLLFLVEALVRIALHTWNHIEADREIAKAEKEAAAHA